MLLPYLSKVAHNRLTFLWRFADSLNNWAWYNDPFGVKPQGSRETYLKLFNETSSLSYKEIDRLESELGFSIEKEWLDKLALKTQIVIKKSKLSYAHGRLLYSVVSKYLKDNPKTSSSERLNIFETGTARGFSALCMAKALSDQDRPGVIITFDVLPHNKPMLWNCITDHEQGRLSRSDLLSHWRDLTERYIVFHQGDTRIELPKVQTDRVHLAYLDGAHTYEDVMFEFEQIREKQTEGDVIIYDDYNDDQFPGLVKAVDEICHLHKYRRIDLKSDQHRGYVIAYKD